MPEHLAIRLTKIDACNSQDELLRVVDSILSDLGIIAYSYIHMPPIGGEKLRIMIPVNGISYAPDFFEIYREKKWYRIDPFIKHAMRSSEVVKWSKIKRLEQGNPELTEFFAAMAETVKGDGLSIAAYGPNNANGFFALATGLEDIDFPAATLNAIRSICRAMHVRYCQLATYSRAKIGLSPREIEVMKLVIEGMTTAKIAEKMDVSPHTVNTYIKRVFDKLEVADRVSASMRFLTLGYLYD